MAFTVDDLMEGLRASRAGFWKHLEGVKEEQWDWKPYPECKSLRETLTHLLCDDRAALFSLETAKEPDYEAIATAIAAETGADLAGLCAKLAESFNTLCAYLQSRYGNASLDTEICVFGSTMKLGRGIPAFSGEDYYHSGQVAFIRMATDPTWNYYAAIYGGGKRLRRKSPSVPPAGSEGLLSLLRMKAEG